MNNFFAALLRAAHSAFRRQAPQASDEGPYVEYKGQKFNTAKLYQDFREYKNDLGNLPTEEARRASELVVAEPFGPRFQGVDEFLAALSRLQFPGYGYFLANQIGARIDPALEIAFVELPQMQKNRYLVAQIQGDGSYIVVDDFVAPAVPEITRVRRAHDGALHYRGRGDVPIQRPTPTT